VGFLALILHNIGARRLRAALTATAVAIGVMAVVALGTLTVSLKDSATGILKVGNADFSVAQKHTDSLLNSTISTDDIARIAKVPGVQSAIGALVEMEKYDSANPAVIQVGLDPKAQQAFGVVLLDGRVYDADSTDQVMLGYVLAQTIHKRVGDTLEIDGHRYRVVGEYRTNVSFGNSTMMFPLPVLQGRYQAAGYVTLGFVKVDDGTSIAKVRAAIDRGFPQLATVASESDYGRVDTTLTLISAANTGADILAVVIATTGVLNTSLLSFFERLREFGVLRAIGWSRGRVIGLVIGEALVVSLVGAAFGVLLGWGAINVLQHLSQLRGVFHPVYESSLFGRALSFAVAVAFLGALYPAVRAATISPAKAISNE
jgi:putative ABC transport system permease protein